MTIGPSIDKFLEYERSKLGAAARFIGNEPNVIVNSVYSQLNYLRGLPAKVIPGPILKGIFGSRPIPRQAAAVKTAKSRKA